MKRKLHSGGNLKSALQIGQFCLLDYFKFLVYFVNVLLNRITPVAVYNLVQLGFAVIFR